MKVVYTGFLKTASRSICQFCKDLLKYEVYQGNRANLHGSATKMIFDDCFSIDIEDLHNCFHKGFVKNADIYTFLEKHKDLIVKEFPYFGMYEYIHNNYEDAKFIICVRDPEEAFNSYKKFMNGYTIKQSFKIHKALLGIADIEITDEHKDIFFNVYNTHNKKVIDFFKDKPGKLLILDFKDIESGIFEEEICKFLGVENTKGLKLDNLKSRKA